MSVTTPPGFTAAGVTAGLKPSGRKDLALVVNQGPSYASASVFTSNRCKANPVLWSQEVVKDGVVRAVVLNSGGANWYTGAELTHRRNEIRPDQRAHVVNGWRLRFRRNRLAVYRQLKPSRTANQEGV